MIIYMDLNILFIVTKFQEVRIIHNIYNVTLVKQEIRNDR